jgi:putative endonuclease
MPRIDYSPAGAGQLGDGERPMREHEFLVYVVGSKRNGTLHTGVATDLPPHIPQHQDDLFSFLARRHHGEKLIYFERHGDARRAARREKQIRTWNRAWTLRLIDNVNPRWEDLSDHPEAIVA